MMFKKYTKQFLDQEVQPSLYHEEDLSSRPHAPFATGLMHSMRVAAQEEEPETIIAENVEIKGSLKYEKLLRIDGSFEGELLSSGKLVVGPNGSVKADIDLDEAYISGKVEGNITVKTRLVLRGRAQVHGNICAPLCSIDEGVSIVGQINVANDVKGSHQADDINF